MLSRAAHSLLVCSLGPECVTYQHALRLQERIAAGVAEAKLENVLLCLQHTPVFTLGKRGEGSHFLRRPSEVHAAGADIHNVARGGEVTFHGPGQLVVYPIFNIRRMQLGPRAFVDALERAMIATAGAWGLQAAGNIPGRTGVWIGDRKLGAVGLRFARGVSTHGIAFNVSTDLTWFDMIVPCGQVGKKVTSLQQELGRPVDVGAVEGQLLRHVRQAFAPDVTRFVSVEELEARLDATVQATGTNK